MTADLDAWQRGYPREQLRALSHLFGEHDRGLVRSRFARFDDAAVAAALSDETLTSVEHDGEITAAAVVRTVRNRTSWRDFRGQTIAELPSGSLLVKRVAARPGYEGQLVELLRSLAGGWYAEAWMEHPTERALYDALGAVWQGSKVSAYGELRGLFAASGDTIDYGVDSHGLARLSIDDIDVAQIRAELDAAELTFADHYSTYNERHSWSACALRGYADDVSFIEKPTEMPKRWRAEHLDMLDAPLRDTAAYAQFPSVRALVAQLDTRAHRVRFMRLAAGGGELSRHADITDPDAGSTNGRLLRLHVPIVTNAAVRFTSWRPDGRAVDAHMAAGTCWWLDTRLPHTARNDGPTARVHLVIDAEATDELRARLVTHDTSTVFAAVASQHYEMVPIDELRTHPRNPRRGDPARIAASIAANDFYGALVVQRSSGHILAGNHRYEAAKLAGLEDLPVIWVDVDDERALRIMLVDNREADIAGYDDAELLALLAELSISDSELIGTGYTTEDLALLASSDRLFDEPDNDDAAALDETPPSSDSYTIIARETIEHEAFTYWRNAGFPYSSQPKHLNMVELNALAACDTEKLVQSRLGYRVADSYHPQRWHAQVESKPSPYDAWADDHRLRIAISLLLDARLALTPAALSHMLGMTRGAQGVSNFRPGFALAVYRMLAPRGATILDTSTGYGGRLVGFIASDAARYIGIDPAPDTCAANRQLVADLCPDTKTVELHEHAAEDIDPAQFAATADLCFTSPPYFAKEHYTNDDTQSWVRYTNIDAWCAGFLAPMLALQHAALRPGCVNAVNIADVTIGTITYPLLDLTIEHALRQGFTLDAVKRFPLPHRFGAGHDEHATSEPLIILRKR